MGNRRMIVGRVLRETVAVIAVTTLAACGRTSVAPVDREWAANAGGVVAQLRADVVAVSGYDRLAAARTGLTDDSQLYGLLVAYTDFGGCRHMVAAVGVEPPGRAHVVEVLARVCARLQSADRLFTRAVSRRDAPLLVRATHEAVAAVPLLDAAALALATGSRGASGR
jgi:hypothetical protein